jgi:hypothetical protein
MLPASHRSGKHKKIKGINIFRDRTPLTVALTISPAVSLQVPLGMVI